MIDLRPVHECAKAIALANYHDVKPSNEVERYAEVIYRKQQVRHFATHWSGAGLALDYRRLCQAVYLLNQERKLVSEGR